MLKAAVRDAIILPLSTYKNKNVKVNSEGLTAI